MSACHEFRDIILTDYIDGELDKKVKIRLEAHLNVCAQCREFVNEVKAQLVVPFAQTPRAVVPEDLWQSIEEKITGEGEQAHPAATWIDRLVQSLALPRSAPVALSFILFISASFWVLHNRQAAQVADNDSGEYAAYVLDSVSELAETGNDSFGTSIEEYFL